MCCPQRTHKYVVKSLEQKNRLMKTLACTHLLKELRSHVIGTVKDNKKLFVFLQFFKQRPGILVTRGQLADLDLQV